MEPRVFLFAGGGTGGHIFPALAIREELRALSGDSVRCVFLCSERSLDTAILERERVEYRVTPSRPFTIRPGGLARFLAGWGRSVRAARAEIRSAREAAGPGARAELVAMGGFVAAPAVQAARAERIPVTLVNLDAVPGKANRWIARRARRVITAAAVDRGDWALVPPIVRAAARADRPTPQCRVAFGLDPDRPTLLVTGASQGARSLNELMARLAADQPERLTGWQIIHQTGAGDDGGAESAYAAAGIPAAVVPFIETMGVAWGAADLALSRAGAGSVAEAWANRVPAVFLPYPHHRDQHQRANAAALVEAGAAVVEEDLVSPSANALVPGSILMSLMNDRPRLESMRAAFTNLGPADGALRCAKILLAPGP